ncbi:MAG: glycogen synthase [Thermoleophilaceae bacterium]|nr:glycogen synthase [Thermoleophilaceae bacterium]
MTTDAVGGVWTYARELAAALRERDVEVTLAVVGPVPEGLDHDVQAIGGSLEWQEDPWTGVELAGRRLLSLADEMRPDVVHLNGYAHAALPWPAPVMVVGHSCVLSWWEAVRGEPAPPEWDRYRREVQAGLLAADSVVAPTAAMLSALRRHYGVSGGRVIHNGLRPEALTASAPKQPLVLGAGRLWDEAKGLTALDDAARRIPWPVEVAGAVSSPAGSGEPSGEASAPTAPSAETSAPSAETGAPSAETGVPSAEWRAASASTGVPSAEWRAASAETGVPSAEWTAASAGRGVPSAEWRATSAETRVPGAETSTGGGMSSTNPAQTRTFPPPEEPGDGSTANGSAEGNERARRPENHRPSGGGNVRPRAQSVRDTSARRPATSGPLPARPEPPSPGARPPAQPEPPTAGARLLGRLAPREMRGLFERAAIFAHPARYEPFGLAPLEAGLASCALVLGDLPSLREVWGDSAAYVPPGDGHALAATLERLIADPIERHDLATRARGRAAGYTADRMADAYIHEYARMRAREAITT